MRNMYDAAWPPASPPKVDAVAGYIGGNTPHVWTEEEWARQPARYRLPIFVRSHDGDPVADAAFSVRWLKAHGVPRGMTLALDYETRVDAAYLKAFDAAVVTAGWRVMVYGSRRFVLQNPKPSGGYWDAEWTNVPHLNAGSAATQYGGDATLGQPYDLSLVADSTPLWDTQEADVTIEELRKELSTIGTPSRKAIYDLAVRAVDDSQAVKGISEAVKAAADPETVASLVAGKLEIVGIATDTNGVVTVTFGAKTA